MEAESRLDHARRSSCSEDEGLVNSEEQDGKRVYTITDAGRAELEERRVAAARRSRGNSDRSARGSASFGVRVPARVRGHARSEDGPTQKLRSCQDYDLAANLLTL